MKIIVVDDNGDTITAEMNEEDRDHRMLFIARRIVRERENRNLAEAILGLARFGAKERQRQGSTNT